MFPGDEGAFTFAIMSDDGGLPALHFMTTSRIIETGMTWGASLIVDGVVGHRLGGGRQAPSTPMTD